jgi:hypothetical protein
MAKKILTDIIVSGSNFCVNEAVSPATKGFVALKNVSAEIDETSNQGVVYAYGGEIKVMDEDRNRTTISPHDEDGKWVFKSENSKTGKSVLIHMEDLVAAVEAHLGVSFSEIVEGE